MTRVTTPDPRLSFSNSAPMLQVAWDSTSLGAFKLCPRYYQYSIVEGWVPRVESVHLTFGLHYHKALEVYDHTRADGATHDEALAQATRRVMVDTWDADKNRPWCSDHPNKNRETLVRSVVWYLDQFADDPIETIILANGQPAVELSFRFESGYVAATGEPFLLSGHLDRLGSFNDSLYVIDRKTTAQTISSDFFDKFSPDNQFTLYTLAGNIVYNTPVVGVICDGAQVAVSFSRFQRGIVTRTKAQLEEWHADLAYWLRQAELFAEAQHWPQNDKACNMFGGCPYRAVCSRSPSVREKWLAASYVKRSWDPLIVRGDV